MRKSKAPCIHCGTTYTHNDRVGCCSACGQVFSGLGAFDAHFGPRGDDGRCPCLDAAAEVARPGLRATPAGQPLFERSVNSRPGQKPLWSRYQTAASIAARLAWIDALGDDS